MDALGIKPGMTIADIGTGRGRLTLPLARHVRASGKVYANDIRADDLAFIQECCRREDLKNGEIVLGTQTDSRLPVKNLDIICMAWVYHVNAPANRVAMLQSLAANLRPSGTLAMAEPKPENTRSSMTVTLAAMARMTGRPGDICCTRGFYPTCGAIRQPGIKNGYVPNFNS